MDFSDARVVITGATGGIGQSSAFLLAQQGASLLLVARDSNKLSCFAKELGDRHQWLSADITTTAGREAIAEKATDFNANILINNAGTSEFNQLANMSDDSLSDAVAINLVGPMCLTRAFLYQVKSSRPKVIINVGSALGSIGYPYYTSYCASKFGLRGFTEALQRELTGSKDTVLYFAPRATATSINSDAVNKMNQALGSATDSPVDVARALVSQLNSGKKRVFIGWPEKIFARLNGFLPEVVDNAIARKFTKIQKFVKLSNN